MHLETLKQNLQYEKLLNYKNLEITGISYNSKTATKNDIFVCLKGEFSDGHDWAKSAYDNGVRVFFTEKELDLDAVQFVVKNTRHQIADLACAFYENPSQKLNLIGVTGTNGKTTVTHLLQKIIEADNKKCALIGTLGYKMFSEDTYHEAKHTTPQAPELQHVLKTALDNNIDNVIMEVSSHSLEQNRVGGCEFNYAVLTNLTQDHLDYHITMNNYFEAKAILFRNLKENSVAIINNDDEYAQKFINNTSKQAKIYTYGIKNQADIMAKDIDFSIHGAKFTCTGEFGEKNIQLKLNGMFSIYNALAALTTAYSMGINIDLIIEVLSKTPCVAGRFEVIVKEPLVIVDYAHTPDGLQNVLKTAREITPKDSNLICLFGCGGDRDATKRPKMGAIAENLSNMVIVTSDNPRSEDPNLIISDIMAGIKSVNTQKIFVEPDRALAIQMIKKLAKPSDVVIVAGKGHEDYQILKDKTIHFDDREEVRKVFN